MKRATTMAVAVAVGLMLVSGAGAASFDYIRLGDNDGFGFTLQANGVIVGKAGTIFDGGGGAGHAAKIFDVENLELDPNNNLTLDPGEYFGDLNDGGSVMTGGWDGFNHRTVAEADGDYVEGSGFTLTTSGGKSTGGSEWTDISITNLYVIQTPGDDFNTHNGGFPDPGGAALPNYAFLRFVFLVNKADISSSQPLYLNVVFGDYEVIPAKLDLVGAGGSFTKNIPLNPQTKDGLIQASYTSLAFNDVFTDFDANNWLGMLDVTFDAPYEPFYALDYVELGTTPIPEPATLAFLALGGVGLLARRRRR
ncbi:MAG: PEP-CTERM sorting domain-containing protein [Phycisphaerae bacterium]